MIQDCKDGKLDICLFTKLDRFFRSVPDYYACIEQMNGVPWRAIWEDYETETSAGIFKVNIMLAVAQTEADRTSERIKATFEYKRSRGDYIGQVPYGYIRKDGKLYKDPAKREAVELLFRTYIESRSTSKAVETVYKRYGESLTLHSAHRILFYGNYSGNMHGHECEPYITKEQEEVITVIKDKNTRKPKENLNTLFNGMCRCGVCGNKLITSACYSTWGGVRHRYIQYRCRSALVKDKHSEKVGVSQKALEQYLLNNIEKILCDYRASCEYAESESSLMNYQKQVDSLNAKLKRIGIRFEDGDITLDEYRKKREDIMYQISSLEKPAVQKSIPQLPHDWSEVYESLDDQHKASFWKMIIEKIIIYPKDSQEPKITFL